MASAKPAEDGLRAFRRNVCSRNGEDGIVAELMRRLGVGTGWFCEVGVGNPRRGSPCATLLHQGWSGVMIDAERSRAAALDRLAARHDGRLHARSARVVPDIGDSRSLDRLLAGTPLPSEFALLALRTGDADYRIWQSFTHYRPLVVAVAIDDRLAPPIHAVHGERGHRGTSFTAVVELADAKAYVPAVHAGALFLVRGDRAAAAGLDEADRRRPDRLFVPAGADAPPPGPIARTLHHLIPQRALASLRHALHL